MDNFTKFTWGVVGILSVIFIAILLAILFALPTYLLWNWIMPIFGLPTLTIWESFGLLLLIKVLFGSGEKQYLQTVIKDEWRKTK